MHWTAGFRFCPRSDALGPPPVICVVRPLDRAMNETPEEKRFKITVLLLVFACFLFIPAAFYYGIAGVLTLVFAALALQHLIAVFRSQPDVCWGAGTMIRFRMSRLSRFVLSLWFVYIMAYIFIRFLLKMPGSPYYLAGHAAFALLVALTRWMDTGRFRL
jgi:hypothetical protein